jgi:enoyl-CoA hydratase
VIRHASVGDSGTVALIEIDRHDKRNALDVDHLDQLHAAVTVAERDGARAVVIAGRGTSFCAGADTSDASDASSSGAGVYGEGFRVALYRALGAIRALPVPVIAAVHGPAIGAGTQLAIACDLRVAGPRARFAVPTARNGLAVDPWTVRRLAVLAGGGAARAMLLGVDTLDVSTAHGRGLVNRVADEEKTLDDAVAWATEIAELAPLSLAYSKLAADRLAEPPVDDPELDKAFLACWDSDDVVEARHARAEGRAPRFSGH